MLARRTALGVLVVALSALLVSEVAAQQTPSRGGRGGLVVPPLEADQQSIQCPLCEKMIEFDLASPPSTCPHCSKKVKIEKTADGWTISGSEANPLKKILLIVGGSVLVLGLIGILLKYTVFAPAKPKKKKKKRRDDDDDDEMDDRPRKRKRPVLEDDEEEERPRKVKKPRIVEDDDE